MADWNLWKWFDKNKKEKMTSDDFKRAEALFSIIWWKEWVILDCELNVIWVNPGPYVWIDIDTWEYLDEDDKPLEWQLIRDENWDLVTVDMDWKPFESNIVHISNDNDMDNTDLNTVNWDSCD